MPATPATITAIANQTGEMSVTATAPAKPSTNPMIINDMTGGSRRCQRRGDVATDDREREPVGDGQREHLADVEAVTALVSD